MRYWFLISTMLTKATLSIRWEGVMLDGGLSPFLRHYLEDSPTISELPSKFSIIAANPADMGSRGGIVIDQLSTPDQ